MLVIAAGGVGARENELQHIAKQLLFIHRVKINVSNRFDTGAVSENL